MLHKDVGGRGVLDRTPILFIKSELHCGCFAPYVIRKFYFIKSP